MTQNQDTQIESTEGSELAVDPAFVRFPKIGQFRNTIQTVQHQSRFAGVDAEGKPVYNNNRLPYLIFRGTVKLHGTNAAVVFRPEGVHFQSRERILSEEADNAGFYAYMSQQYIALEALKNEIVVRFGLDTTKDTIAVFGEWCGGNIQPNVALTQLPKMFVFYMLNINGMWFEVDQVRSRAYAKFYSILDFPSFYRHVDFNSPELIQNELARLTLEVEQQCPVAKALGVDGIGEGIVWRAMTRPHPDYWFKVKGEKHSASKVKTLAAVDTEKVASIAEFVQKTVTENRLNQAYAFVIHELRKPFDPTSVGDFIRWVVSDILKEEADTLQASGLTPKEVNPKISQAAKTWYFQEMGQRGVI